MEVKMPLLHTAGLWVISTPVCCNGLVFLTVSVSGEDVRAV